MVLKINKRFILLVILVTLILLGITLISFVLKKSELLLGGKIYLVSKNDNNYAKEVSNIYNEADYDKRFMRPSSQAPINTLITFNDVEKNNKIISNIKNPEDVIYAYYGILKEASNMLGYSGGCGSIGDGTQPYKYAYELFTSQKKQEMSLDSFIASFKGVGHINLLKLIPLYSPNETPENIKYYMVELELITGNENVDTNISNFQYYYGLITVEYDKELGWQIKDIKYVPEVFLCAPYHGWIYLGEALVEIVYGEWYKIIDKIDKTEFEGDKFYVYASGKDKYRFDFIRLTNGYDILVSENVLKDGKWMETSILREEDQYLKFSILNPNLK